MAAAEVTLGAHVIALQPVSIPRARRGVIRALDGAGSSLSGWDPSTSVGALFGALGSAGEQVLYDLLSALLPGFKARMPLWEFCGYGSQEAMDREDYDEDQDHAPTSAQIQEALSAAWEVSQLGKWIRPLGGVLDPRTLQAVVTGVVEDAARNISSTMSLSSSGASPSTNGSPTPEKASRPPGSKRSSLAAVNT